MGVVFQKVLGDATKFPPESGTMMWLVCRRDGTKNPAEYHIQGLSPDQTIAENMCLDDTYFMGPIPVNTAIPTKTIEWAGCYFPKKKQGFITISLAIYLAIIISNLILLFQDASWNWISTLWTAGNTLAAIANAYFAFKSKDREEIRRSAVERADEAEKLVKSKDVVVKEVNAKVLELEKEILGLSTEYKALAGIKIHELVEWYKDKESREAEVVSLRSKVGSLTRRLSNYEEIHDTHG